MFERTAIVFYVQVSATPILDLEQPPPAPSKRWVPILAGVVIGLAMVTVSILADQGLMFDWNWPAFNGLLFVPALLCAIAAHEMGHLIAGEFLGFGTAGISVGPLLLIKSGKTWVFEFKWGRFFAGSFHLLSTQEDFMVLRYIWMIAAGPLASFLLAALCAALVSRDGNGAWNWTGTVCWASLLIGVASALPFSSSLRRSDGAWIWQLLRHPEQTHRLKALLAIQSDDTNGIRPRDWRRELFSQLLAVAPTAPEYTRCQLLAFYRLLDEGDEIAALQYLENALGKSGKADKELRSALFREAACACARIKNEPGKARAWRERALPLSRNRRETLQAVDACIAMSEGRFEEALQLWQSVRDRILRRKLDSGLVRFALDKWAEFGSACEGQIAARSSQGHPALRRI
jgi:hypothetical protein